MKRKFVPMVGLDNLTEEEKLDYYTGACEYFNVPAELNLLQFIWMYTEGSNDEKHLVLYAKRGATDIMRANHGICVDEIKETIGEGFVTFTAKGHDKTGRTDVAVGAASIKNLTGRALSNELMTAQTRATRRLTLQFVGGGLLDESEVQLTPTPVVNSPAQPVGIVAAQPTVAPNAAPGTDITEKMKLVPAAREKEMHDALTGDGIFSPDPPFVLHVAPAKVLGESPQDAAAPAPPPERKKRKRRNVVSLEPEGSVDILPMPILPKDAWEFVQKAQDATKAASGKNDKIIVSPKADILESPRTPTPEEIEEKEIQELKAKQAARRAEAVKPAVSEVVPNLGTTDPKQGTEVPLPPKPPVIGNLPKEEQMKDFKARLFVYTNDVLRKGGMKGCEGIGGIEYKMRAFIRLMFPQAQDTKFITVDQWETFFGYMDTKLSELGPEGLVQHVNQKIGAKE